jgi:CheY-like chemotaxis protein
LRTFEDAYFELRRSPAHALIVNDECAEYGSVLAEHAASLPYGTPVIACWMSREEQVAKQMGVLHYLVKPVTRTKLLSVVGDLGNNLKTILVVDDDADALQFFARILLAAGRGYRVLRASDGQHALALLRERRPDLVLLDMIMPGMDGFTLLQKKNQDREICDIPVIVISASDPLEEPMMTNFLTATRSRGISLRDFITFIHSFSDLSPYPSAHLSSFPSVYPGPSVDPAQIETRPG